MRPFRAAAGSFGSAEPRALGLALFCATLALSACTAPVATNLDDADANEVRVVLDRAGVAATREADPSAEGKYRIVVPDDDAAQAAAILKDEMLPRERPKGLLESLGQGSLVPSGQAEQAQYARGMAGELERSLGGIEGVLRARVHLQVPAPDPLHLQTAPKATASVLLEYRGDVPPLSAEAVQKLVAGGAPSLSEKDVAVVFVPRRQRNAASAERLARVGPFAVSRGAQRPLQVILGVLFLAVLGLAGACLALYLRGTRQRRAAARSDGGMALR
ncbi:MAG: hypothetical protein U0174_24210 [Polyangiaceae bacterium]